MHYVVAKKNDNLWIAQREGRAKDSNDRTQPAILKMMEYYLPLFARRMPCTATPVVWPMAQTVPARWLR